MGGKNILGKDKNKCKGPQVDLDLKKEQKKKYLKEQEWHMVTGAICRGNCVKLRAMVQIWGFILAVMRNQWQLLSRDRPDLARALEQLYPRAITLCAMMRMFSELSSGVVILDRVLSYWALETWPV